MAEPAPGGTRRMRFATALAAAGFVSGPAFADLRSVETTSPPSVTIHIEGKFVARDFNLLDGLVERLEKRFKREQISVNLNSPGGAHFEGLRAGLLLRRKGIGTMVLPGASCLSACSSIFFGGFDLATKKPNRIAYEGSRIGVHQMVRADGLEETPQQKSRVQNAARLYFDEVGVSKFVQHKLFETPPNDIYLLTLKDMAESGITFRVGKLQATPQLSGENGRELQRTAAPVSEPLQPSTRRSSNP